MSEEEESGTSSCEEENDTSSSSDESEEEEEEEEHSEEEGKKVKKGRLPLMKRKVIGLLDGPILFTSPHGLTVMRHDDGENWRSHARERWATSVALQLSQVMEEELGGASFIIWNEDVAKPRDRENLDPNYLTKKQFKKCPFHQNILKMKEKFPRQTLPTINFDCHGRAPRKKRITLEVGMAVFRSKWGKYSGLSEEESEKETKKVNDVFKEEMEKVFKKWNKIRKRKKDEDRCNTPFTVDMNPYFSGWWGGGLHTVSHQCTKEGIIGIQLEFPTCIRRKLANDKEFMKDFGEAIICFYERSFNIRRKKVKEVLVKGGVRKKKKDMVFDFEKYIEETVRMIDDKKKKRRKKKK